MISGKLIKNVTLKDGTTYDKGISGEVHFDLKNPSYCALVLNGRSISARSSVALTLIGKKAPTVKTMEKWSFDGVAKSVGNKSVEPDGWDPNGNPSWLLILGYI